MSAKKAAAKKRGPRQMRPNSNIFAMFDQAQIQEFKEAFNLIDQNHDGIIDRSDLNEIFVSLGQEPADDYLDDMVAMASGQLNFTMFLTLFGEKLNGTDPEDVIRNAFTCFDEEGSGTIHEERLREILTTMGDRFTDEEVDGVLRGAPIDTSGRFNYRAFSRIMKHGNNEGDK